MKSLRIHYTTPVWHGGFREFFGRALKSLGHEVIFFNDGGTKWQYLFERVATRIPKFQYAAEDIFRRYVSNDWLKSVLATEPDLIILEHAPNILADAVREARKLKKPVFYWLDSGPTDAQAKDILVSLPYTDKIFTIDRAWMTLLYEPRDFEYLPLAGDPQKFYPLPKKEMVHDVVFVGSLPPQDGNGYLRAKILSEIPKRFRVAVYGTGLEYWYKYFPSLASRAKNGRLSAAALNEVYNQSRLLLNIHSTFHRTSVSARTYEAALAGTFQIVDHRADIDELFPKDSLVTFRYAREIVPLIDEWLDPSKDSERKRRVEGIRETVLNQHTWRHRAEEMLKYLD